MSETAQSQSQVQRTPLYDRHVALGAKMVPFAGWEMPLHYGSQVEEHHATRRSAGVFDVSHMGQIMISGPQAERLVQELATNDLSRLSDGDELYTVMCDERGGMIDDLIIARFAADQYFIVANAATYLTDFQFIEQLAAEKIPGDKTHLDPCSEDWAMIAIQGPEFAEILNVILGEGPWDKLKPFKIFRGVHNGVNLIISTTGYTGEPGAEILCPPEDVGDLWDAMVEAGARPCGLAARDTLRLEKGYLLSGQDFTTENNPLEAGVGWVVKLDKKSFSGKYALMDVKAAGPARKLMGFLPEGKRIPRHGAEILAEGVAVGYLTSGSWSPSLERPIAMGYIDSALANPGAEVQISLGSTTTRAVIVKPPFFPLKAS